MTAAGRHGMGRRRVHYSTGTAAPRPPKGFGMRVPVLPPVVIVLAAATGCVDRRFVVESNVPGAQISVDGNPIGPAPVDSQYTYAGVYTFTATAPGYEPLTQRVDLKAKWYQYPPLDFFAEILYPGRIEDVRRVQLNLAPARPVSDAELLGRAEGLRARGMSLRPPRIPNNQGADRPGSARPGTPAGPGPSAPTLAAPRSPGGPNPQVPATELPSLASPRDGDTNTLVRPPAETPPGTPGGPPGTPPQGEPGGPPGLPR